VQSFLGVTQQRVSDSNDQIDNQVKFLSTSIDGLEQVDSASVLTQVTQLQTQLEAAYTITSQISKLSIMDYMT
jgi:flagellar hook-associated protein 3 FlgL